MRQHSSLLPMISLQRCGEVCSSGDGFDGADVDEGFIHVGEPEAVAVYAFGGARGVRSEFVGHDADSGAVCVVEKVVFEVDEVVAEVAYSEEGGCGPDRGSGEMEEVEEGSV